MSLQLIRYIVALLVLTASIAARAEVPDIKGAVSTQSKPVDQILYKGVVGNLLDAVPLDPHRRVDLQRTNAVVSSVFSGRTLAVLLGVANPALMVGGLAWGLWSASKIKPVAGMARGPVPSLASESPLESRVPRPSLPVVPLLAAPAVKPAVADEGATHAGSARPIIEPLADASALESAAN